MLVELGLVEQRYQVVREVLDGAVSITEAAQRAGVTRQSVHRWLRRHAALGLAGLADRPSVPDSCPHQMSPETVLATSRFASGCGPRPTPFSSSASEGFVACPRTGHVCRLVVQERGAGQTPGCSGGAFGEELASGGAANVIARTGLRRLLVSGDLGQDASVPSRCLQLQIELGEGL